ncbi:hypothetical protein VPH35_066212 [Triticum aestivum]
MLGCAGAPSGAGGRCSYAPARARHRCGSYTFRRIPTSPPPTAYSVTRRRSSCGWMLRRRARRQRVEELVCACPDGEERKMLLEWEHNARALAAPATYKQLHERREELIFCYICFMPPRARPPAATHC